MSRYVLLVEISPVFSIKGNPPTGLVGATYSYEFFTYGADGSITWALQPGYVLPAGWSFSSAGTLAHAGTLSAPDKIVVSIQATDASFRTVLNSFKITIEDPLP